MIRSSTVTLIQMLPGSYGVYETPAETERIVPCDVQSVSRTEVYEAMTHGLHPELVLVLYDYAEYKNENVCAFEGQRYRIIRTYVRSDNAIELVIERMPEHGL